MKQMKVTAGLLLFDFLVLYVTKHVAGAADFYADEIYPFFLNTVGRLFGFLPWSVAELLIYILIGLCFWWLGGAIRLCRGKSPKRKVFIKNGLCNLLLAAAIFFTTFSLTEGPNYARTSFAKQAGMERQEYSTEELAAVYADLIQRANELAVQVLRDEQGLMQLGPGAQDEAVASMKALGERYLSLGGYYPRPKKVLVSQVLSLQDITGIYTPFTVEANYNRDVIAYNQPFTMCHELSHLKGFMQEAEANFIAFLACEQSEDVQFQYSGALLGMIYCGNELYRRQADVYSVLRETIDVRVQRDLEENAVYWDRYQGLIARFSQQVNDVYLKVNQQSEGVNSYDKVVDLIVQHKSGISQLARACFKNHSRHPYASLCGIFAPYSVDAARCTALIWSKSPTNCDARLT